MNEHPWKQSWQNQAKLKAAKAEAQKRAKKKYDHEHYDEYKKLQNRMAYRVKTGIPSEAPLLKPWEHVKGKL